MKANLFCMLFCAGMLCSCEPDETVGDSPVNPPVEQPGDTESGSGTDESSEQPAGPFKGEEIGIYNIKIDNEVMAIVGSNNWNDICYGNGKCVAVGDDNNIAYSHDNGNSWNTAKTSATGIKWNAIMYDEINNNFVGCGEQNRILHTVSGDITSWVVQNHLYGGNWTDVIYDNLGNNYVGIIISSSNSTKIVYKGTTYGCYYKNDRAFIGTKIIKGHDDKVYGIVAFYPDWPKSELKIMNGDPGTASILKYFNFDSYILNDIAYGNNVYVAVGNSGIIVSVYKDTYEIIHEKNVGTNNWNAIVFEKGVFIAVGDSGHLATSVDGINWHVIQHGSGNLKSVCVIP